MVKTLRVQRISVFGYVEGETEEIFLRHLVDLYAPQRRIHFLIRIAGGKGPAYILDKACRVRGNHAYYNHSFILLDTDVPWPATLRTRARSEHFELLGNTPCAEGLFLTILNSKEDHTIKSPDVCKREFEKTYTNGDSITRKNCGHLFPVKYLDSAKERIPVLARIIEIVSGRF